MHHFPTSSPFLLNFNIWTLPLVVSHSSTSKTLYFFLYYLLFSYFHFFFHPTLHYPTCYHLKFILGNQFPLCLLLLIPAVTGQVSKLPIFPTHSFFPFFYFCLQFSESILLIEHAAHKRFVLFQRHYDVFLEKSNESLISLITLCLLGYKIFTQPESYCPTCYCPNTIVILSLQERISNLNAFLRMQHYSSACTAYNRTSAQGL